MQRSRSFAHLCTPSRCRHDSCFPLFSDGWRRSEMRRAGVVVLLLLPFLGCDPGAEDTRSVEAASLTPQQEHGKNIWLNSTFGGEQFLSVILPKPPFDIQLGFDAVLA